jgi:hypothetical protein
MSTVQELERRLAALEAEVGPTSAHAIIDSRLSEKQKRHMKHMMDTLGLSEAEAKVKVLCMGVPPDHFEVLPPGNSYPRMIYSKEGKFHRVENEDEHAELRKAGWLDRPLKIHLDKLQRSTVARDEQIARLKKELDREIADKAIEKADTVQA